MSAIIGSMPERLRTEDHAALLGTGVVIGLELLSLTQSGDAAADTAAFGAALLIGTVVLWFAAKLARRDRR
jgi:hypothetical protein